MKGDERVRHCTACGHNVYNLSNMSPAEARSLVQNHEGRLCVRFYRRPDDTVIAKNCPVGLSAMRKRLAYAVCIIAVFALSSFSLAMARLRGEDPSRASLMDSARQWPVIGSLIERVHPSPVMGMLTK